MTMLANDAAVESVAPGHRGCAPISASTQSAFHQVQSAKGDEARQAQLNFLIAVASEALAKAIGLSATKDVDGPSRKGQLLQHSETLPDRRNVSAIAARWAHFSVFQFLIWSQSL
ncbi:hypothetical protein AB8Z38_34045 [Bradyrhizobium sp. LLZ17]|uniref:Uncharacterized protein n=1 Tax=Bradyrhizobium sp. LLZ17 TaxID=3239388 RepID=A0AB39XJY9_9BRAD